MREDPASIHVRDPIHGSIRLTRRELDVVETRVFQRLRGIRQLGFADQAFPGATHTRFSHGLGAMEMASRMFDAALSGDCGLKPEQRRRLRQIVRLAVLLHDVGHAPLSHATEACMPRRADLPAVDGDGDGGAVDDDGGAVDGDGGAVAGDDGDGRGEAEAHTSTVRATHEDYTIVLLLQSELADQLRSSFGDDGIDPRDIAHLISGRFDDRAPSFVVNGLDFGPLLGQLVAGELDADRMDYLQRDSYYAGVSYGKFDDQWLLNNLTFHRADDRVMQALNHRAIFAFEDFLLSRYHMFVSVYYHHTPVGLDTMLSRFIEEEPEAFVIPRDPERYVALDDVSFWATLRASKNRWAQRITGRRLYRRVVELNADEGLLETPGLKRSLAEAGVDYFISRDEGVLSRYYRSGIPHPIYVINRELRQASRVDRYSKLFQRYGQPTRLSRLYCRPDQVQQTRRCLARFIPRQSELDLGV